MDYDEEDLIRSRAHEIWEREGRPEGRADAHWNMAREELGQAANQDTALEPNPIATEGAYARRGQPVEPLEPARKQGDMPGLRDQGDEQSYRAPPQREEKVPPPRTP